MCGICGVLLETGATAERAFVERMCAQIVHRGPDEEGMHSDGELALGIRRLSIIDVEGGTQPIYNEDRSVCVVQNGEIYNFHELRSRLERSGHRFSTRSDTEVIVHLYEEHGLSFVDHLNGMFAIALWDAPRRRLVLVRDRLGQKPLYYARVPGALIFGSELKSLLEYGGISREIDPQALYDYFALGYIPQPRSIYSAVKKLPPSGRLIAESGKVSVDRYWQLPASVDRKMPKAEAVQRLRRLLLDSVRLRMISDVPLGAFLSGGVDSSITVALMAQASREPVKTFFIDFDECGFSEREYARAVAKRYRTEHHELTVKPQALEILDRVISQFDEPFGDSSAIPTFYVSELTRRYVTVALSGDGGDESFGGYRRYRVILNRREQPVVRTLLRYPARILHGVLPRRAPGRRYFRSLGISNAEYYALATRELEARELLSRDFLKQVEKSVLADLGETDWPSNGDPLLPYSRFDLKWYLPDDILTKVDRMSMAHSLEVRSPFLDYRVVELAARMPADWKINRRDSKVILKEAFGSELPSSVLAPRKRGFSIPLANWFRNELRPALQELRESSALAGSGIFNMDEIRGLIDEHLSGARNRKSELWRILFFARWLELQQTSSKGARVAEYSLVTLD